MSRADLSPLHMPAHRGESLVAFHNCFLYLGTEGETAVRSTIGTRRLELLLQKVNEGVRESEQSFRAMKDMSFSPSKIPHHHRKSNQRTATRVEQLAHPLALMLPFIIR
jgi:hypothetical protein